MNNGQAGATTPEVKCLPRKHEGQSSDPCSRAPPTKGRNRRGPGILRKAGSPSTYPSPDSRWSWDGRDARNTWVTCMDGRMGLCPYTWEFPSQERETE